MGGYRSILLQGYHFSGLDDKHLWAVTVVCYILEVVRILSLLIVFLIFLATPTRYDYFLDFPIYLSRYIREILLLEESPGGRLSFFVHAWNAWGYCGAVRQGSSWPQNSTLFFCPQFSNISHFSASQLSCPFSLLGLFLYILLPAEEVFNMITLLSTLLLLLFCCQYHIHTKR